jgi:signal transduction histidine kinase
MTSPSTKSSALSPLRENDEDRIPEISTRVVAVFFLYFEHRYGRERTLQAIKRIGGTPDLEFVKNSENFVSLGYCLRVAQVLTDEASDPEFLRQAGLYQVSGPTVTGFAYYVLRSLGSPRLYYRTAVRMGHLYNRIGEMSIEELTSTRLRLRYRSLKPEGSRLLCEGRMGQLAAAPTLWGLPAASVSERECQVRGADACVYEAHWQPLTRPMLRAIGGAVLGALALLPSQITANILWGALCGALIASTLAYRAQSHRAQHHILDAVEGSTRSMEELRLRFEEVQRLQRDMELTNQSLLAEMDRRKHVEAALVESQKLEAIGRLAGGIAHDFNNILTVILNYAQFARERSNQIEVVDSSLLAISTSASRAADLTRQLLAFARRQVGESRVIEIGQQLLDSVPILDKFVGGNFRLETALNDDAACVVMDPGQLEQILLNLVSNARDAMLEGGTIHIETGRADFAADDPARPVGLDGGTYAVLSVMDTGIGMDAATKQHIFEPFFTTKEVGKGTGLGLATCHGIVTQANGTIAVDSAPNQGTTIRIYLPMVQTRTSLSELTKV